MKYDGIEQKLESHLSGTSVRDPSFGNTILILYTGGTIGMVSSDNGYLPSESFPDVLQSNVLFHDDKFRVVDGIMTTPLSRYKKRSRFMVKSYSKLLDSAKMTPQDWIKIAEDIEEAYDKFDAFIILHGTDTMAYTSSALSFMLQNLRKTVLLTGSQIPISEPQSDGIDNLIGALAIAGHFTIPEVCIYFHSKLFRGNRASKIHSESFDAFNCPNFPPLATIGTKVNIKWELIRSTTNQQIMKQKEDTSDTTFKVQKQLSRDVVCVRLYPGMSIDVLRKFFEPPVKGVVLQTFGAGNAPVTNKFLNVIKNACDRGVVIVNITQCTKGNVSFDYEAGSELAKLGVVGGYDLTVESALAKLSYLIGMGKSVSNIRQLMGISLRGELTMKVDHDKSGLQDSSFIHAVVEALSAGKQRHTLSSVANNLGPTLLLATIANGKISDVEKLIDCGISVNSVGYDGKTGAHVACMQGRIEIIKLLFSYGANFEATSVRGYTPLDYLLDSETIDNIDEIISLLRDNHVQKVCDIGIRLCRAASKANLVFFQRCLTANIDITSTDYDGRSALHLAASEGHYNICRWLLLQKFPVNIKDRFGNSPREDAIRHGHGNIERLLTEHENKLKQKE